ncbi:MAG: hypothetical protein AMJ95_08075 [Omnitrophica WOR_2 bacterium SM23_72]|nr:MAG: hypothetical protein AMJ95_08075 [Omnitrophica WOR_2 bacterium SM23_72]
MRLLKKIVHKLGRWYIRELNKREYKSQRFKKNERDIEYRFVFNSLLQTNPITVLDIGSGTTSLPSLMNTCGFVVTAIDNIYDYWPSGMFNKHFYVVNDNIVQTKITEKFDLITCISVLEHIKNHKSAIQNMFSLLKPGGHLVLTFPYNENSYIENVYKVPNAGYGQNVPFICQVYSRNELNSWLKDNGGILLEQEYWQVFFRRILDIW